MRETPDETPQEPAGGNSGVNEEQHVPAAPVPAGTPEDGETGTGTDEDEDEDAAE